MTRSALDRDQKLAQVLVEFARTLGTDFALEAILDHLVKRVVDVLPVTGAGVMLMDPGADLHFIAASNAQIQEIEDAQKEYGEGPCLEAFRTGNAVAIPDLSTDQRFPQFSSRTRAAGLASVFTFPMRLDERRMGALDLYRDTCGDLTRGDREAAQSLADVAAAYIFNAQARASAAGDLASATHSSLHDPLTGLANRTLLTELLERAVMAARQARRAVGVVLVDLDRFKSVNDRFGHRAGDSLLVEVSVRLRAVLRPGDTLARLAGDEFVIVCEDLADPSGAERVAERISHCLVEPFEVDGRAVTITASVGVAFSAEGQDIPASLLHHADFAMHDAKTAGGAHHRLVNHAALAAADQSRQLEEDLAAALRRGDLTVAYQPICRAHDGALVAVEALLRWTHPTRGPISPDVIIPLAERTGLIHPLGEWVLRRACTDFVRWRATYPGAIEHVAVNLSACQVVGRALVPLVADVLRSTGMTPSALHLEVTEGVFLDNASRARAVLGEVKDLGIQLSLDDFGTGYSSLTYLKQFPFDYLKIDRTFIADLTEDGTSVAILRAIIDMSRALDLQVIAEGIEAEGQLIAVADLGSDLAQGYYLSRPLLAADLQHQFLDHAPPHGGVRLPRHP